MNRTTLTHDSEGIQWAKLSELEAGKEVELDSGFTCHAVGKVMVHKDDDGHLYFECANGRHLFKGQADDGEHCVGVYA